MTADGWIRWYFARKADAGAPGLDLVDSRGYVFSSSCPACGHRKRHETRVSDFVCGSCGAPWPYEERFLLKGEVSRAVKVRGRRVSSVPYRTAGDSERRYARLVDVGIALGRLLDDRSWRWPARFYLARCVGFGADDLAERAGEIIAGAPKVSERTARRWIADSRREWTDRLTRIGVDCD